MAKKCMSPPAVQTFDPVRMTLFRSMIGFNIHLLNAQGGQLYSASFRNGSLTRGAFAVLATIRENPGIGTTALASALFVRETNMTKLIKNLEQNELVARKKNPRDKRAIGLTITQKSEIILDTQIIALKQLDVALAEGLSLTERQQLLDLLQKMSRHIRKPFGSLLDRGVLEASVE